MAMAMAMANGVEQSRSACGYGCHPRTGRMRCCGGAGQPHGVEGRGYPGLGPPGKVTRPRIPNGTKDRFLSTL
jgi:hypothetical protein